MALIVAVTTVVTDTAYFVESADDLQIDQGVVVQSLTRNAIVNYFGTCTVLNNGTISAALDGVQMGLEGAEDGRIEKDMTVTNTGRITAERYGVALYGAGTTVTNSGFVLGNDGIHLQDTSSDEQSGSFTSTVNNSGTIIGEDVGIRMSGNTVTAAVSIVNSGTIAGLGDAAIVIGADFADIINTGRIIGDIKMLGIFNTYDGRTGTVDGTVFGGGRDKFVTGTGRDAFDGGDDNDDDQVVFESVAGVHYALDATFAGTGITVGDTYTSIEGLVGSDSGADRLRGDDNTNMLRGRGGADMLAGVQGNDTLIGGAGRDYMSGGAGVDTFMYFSVRHGGDRIADFEGGAAGGDSIALVRGAVEGSGLRDGVLAARHFRARADNLAQDADDRIIFRTTDKTLWFDKNGNAVGGLSLIADLQATAVVVAADISIVDGFDIWF